MDYKLTQYSHGAGCGCKIAPQVLDAMLQSNHASIQFTDLLVGNAERDDAAVMRWGDGQAVVSTTDFFMPIVDDPFDFGQIAAVNAISDIYAMGAEPLLAIAILGWPVAQLPPQVANRVIAGGREACSRAGIPLAGGHSIDCPEPIFGLAVTGRVAEAHLKKNGGAKPGDRLYLTKPLGVGILTTAQKKGLLRPEDAQLARQSMIELNAVGAALGRETGVHAMTDVTGFGLMGHLLEMCQASGTQAWLDFAAIPLLDAAVIAYYLEQGSVPGGTQRNFASYGQHLSPLTPMQQAILCDPQTSGGLLIAVDPRATAAFETRVASASSRAWPIGTMRELPAAGPSILLQAAG